MKIKHAIIAASIALVPATQSMAIDKEALKKAKEEAKAKAKEEAKEKAKEKMEEKEPHKLLGTFDGVGIRNADFVISAHCNRVATRNGHLEAVSVEFEVKPTEAEILEAWHSYKPLAQQLNLPNAPQPAILYDNRPDRPQPRLDRLAGSVPGMATVIGRLRPDPLLHYKFMVLGHNTIRGAAGGSLLNAELLVAQGYVGQSNEVLAHSVQLA